jgi:flagellar basal body-associated protein FliL
MKIEQLIVQYLYQEKKVTLEGIGSFYLSPDISISTSVEPVPLPDNSIQFELNSKAIPDEGLIKFIVEKTRKFKPLAVSDLESFSILGKQFLNLGKPFLIKEVGSLLKNQNNEYEFTQATYIFSIPETTVNSGNTQKETSKSAKLPKPPKQENIDFSAPSPVASKKKFIIPITVLVFVIAAMVVLFNKFGSKNNKDIVEEKITTPETNQVVKTTPPPPPTPTPASVQDTLIPAKDTIAVVQTPPVPAKDTAKPKPPKPVSLPVVGYKVIVREYADKESADKGMIALSRFEFGKNLILYAKDTNSYKIAVAVRSTYKDTTRVKDSLRNLFGKKTSIDLH